MKITSLLACLGLASLSLGAQSRLLADESPGYTEGSVWRFSFIKTMPGKKGDYIENLRANYRKELDEAIREGVILSYKVIVGDSATKDDWSVILMLEVKNMAALDGFDRKMDAIAPKVLGSKEADAKGDVVRAKMREYLGIKSGREILFN